MTLQTIKLCRVQYMPKKLEPGILYVAEQFGAAAHLCACGCGAKIRTPLNPMEWSLAKTQDGPSLWPSVGNWQQACKSHYVIRRGTIVWYDQWTQAQITAGRKQEEKRRAAYYDNLYSKEGIFARIWNWLKIRISK